MLVIVILAGVVARTLYFYVPWVRILSDFKSNARVLGEVSHCLGFFDATRTFRIESKAGDGSGEMVRMSSLAGQYVQLQRRAGLSGIDFAPSIMAGRKVAKDALFNDVLVARFSSRALLAKWTAEGERCLEVEDQAKRRIAAEPDRPFKLPVGSGLDTLIEACDCRGRLRADYMNADAQAALRSLAPLTNRATREIFERCEAASESGRLAFAPLPTALVKAAGLLEECYALAAAVR